MHVRMQVNPPIQPFDLAKLETDARHVSDNIMHLIGGLTSTLHAVGYNIGTTLNTRSSV